MHATVDHDLISALEVAVERLGMALPDSEADTFRAFQDAFCAAVDAALEGRSAEHAARVIGEHSTAMRAARAACTGR